MTFFVRLTVSKLLCLHCQLQYKIQQQFVFPAYFTTLITVMFVYVNFMSVLMHFLLLDVYLLQTFACLNQFIYAWIVIGVIRLHVAFAESEKF